MSWTVDGNTYHTWAEYQRALTRRRRRLTEARVGQTCRDAERIRERMRSREAELQAASGNADLQARLRQELELDVREMRALGTRLKTTEREARDELEAALAGEPGTCPGTSIGNAADRGEQPSRATTPGQPAPDGRADEVHELEALLERTRGTLEGELAAAEQRRLDSEARLDQALRELEQAAERERNQRLAARRDERDRAAATIAAAAEVLAATPADLPRLELADDRDAAAARVDQARRLIEQGDVAAALAVAAGALTDASSLGTRARRRGAELAAWRDRALSRAASLREVLDHPEVERYFGIERSRARAILDVLERRARTGYASYRRLEVEADQDDRRLAALEDETERMLCCAPMVKELAAARTQQAKELVGKLAGVYGPVTHIQQHFAVSADRKSSLVVQCEFGGARVDLHLSLEGGFTIDGYGHDSNATCSRKSEDVVRSLMGNALVTGSRVDPGENRAAPAAGPATGDRWQGISSRLDAIEKMT